MKHIQITGERYWFDSDRATKWHEGCWWNGSNMISCATGSQWEHQALYRTAGGRWVLDCSTRRDTYTLITDYDALDWLLANGHDEDAARLWPAEVQAAEL